MAANLFTLDETREKTKKDQVYEYLHGRIVDSSLPPGTLLVERNICATLDVSRTPVREAIQDLIHEGLVNSLSNKSCVVAPISYEDIANLYDVREYMEGLAVRLCVQRIKEEELEELKGYFELMDGAITSTDYAPLFEADVSFHKRIVNSSGNIILINVYDQLRGRISRITRLTDRNSMSVVNSHEFHSRILEAIVERDASGAEAAIREHIRDSKVAHLRLFVPNLEHSTL